MRIAVFSAKHYDRTSLAAANVRFGHDLVFMEPCLELATTKLADGFAGVCVFVNDCLDQAVLVGGEEDRHQRVVSTITPRSRSR